MRRILLTRAPYFIDKNPNNFIFVGLLKLAIPNAKIINARRHPLDSCLGSFKQLFASGQPFSYDMTELGEYYLQYQRLMDHWHRVLPGFVLDVNYEDVVGDLETEVRRLLEFCDLPFEDNCLRFHETVRAVKTASSEQVRQPIYSSSVNLWRNYEDQLESLVHIMKPLLLAMPEMARPASLLPTKR
ncbi:MAG TPA: sulfotransferase [Woeseiaceae bacterium]|nr:sulfotransferase [Woeseiaceae bacterium]